MVPNPGENIASFSRNIGFEFDQPLKINLDSSRVNNFSELTIYYKNLFHIKSDNSLRYIITKVNNFKKWNEKVDIRFSANAFTDNLEFFTDVDKLIQAYNKIIQLIIKAASIQQNGNPKVILSLIEGKDREIIFEIDHVNSVYQKSILNTIDRIGVDQTSLIEKQINGLCDLYLKADFGYESAEINLWDGSPRNMKYIDPLKGVKYILKFRK